MAIVNAIAYGARVSVVETIERVETVRFSAEMLRKVLGLPAQAQLLVEVVRCGPAMDDEPERVTYDLDGDLIGRTKTIKQESR